jgi:hypothetical protein
LSLSSWKDIFSFTRIDQIHNIFNSQFFVGKRCWSFFFNYFIRRNTNKNGQKGIPIPNSVPWIDTLFCDLCKIMFYCYSKFFSLQTFFNDCINVQHFCYMISINKNYSASTIRWERSKYIYYCFNGCKSQNFQVEAIVLKKNTFLFIKMYFKL